MAPSVVVLDVNETLSDLSPLEAGFAGVGAPPWLARLFLPSVLRDGLALAATGAAERFAVLADQTLHDLLAPVVARDDLEAAVATVTEALGQLPVHPDVADGIRALRAAGLRVVTLSNGPRTTADGLLERAGVRDAVELVLSVEDAGIWKPAAGAYAYGARACGVDPSEMVLVAVHPWDLDGAAKAGLSTAWLDRAGGTYPAAFRRPDHEVRRLGDLAVVLRSG